MRIPFRGEQFGSLERLTDGLAGNNAGLAERGLVNGETPGKRSVWEDAAFCPIFDEPDFIAMIGFFSVIRLTISINRFPNCICSI